MRSQVVALGTALALFGIVQVASAQGEPQGSSNQGSSKQGSSMMQGHEMMQGQMNKGQAANTEACQEIMAMRKQMRADRIQNDEKLNKMLGTMNSATGQEKVDALAAIVTEMVNQRQAMHEKMASLYSRHGMQTMRNCPMWESTGDQPSEQEWQ